jgi:hypothetical protein
MRRSNLVCQLSRQSGQNLALFIGLVTWCSSGTVPTVKLQYKSFFTLLLSNALEKTLTQAKTYYKTLTRNSKDSYHY